MAFKAADISVHFEGEGEGEVGKDADSGSNVVRVNPRYYRPAEVDLLIGDPAKARGTLGWQASTSLEDLCAMMVEADLIRNKRGVSL